MDRAEFVTRFGGIFEHSAFIAERAFDCGDLSEKLDADSVYNALVAQFRMALEAERLGVLRAHPDLAGKLALADGLTADSKQEQAGAGLDRLSAVEHGRFTDLNNRYLEKFGFPFIIAIRGLDRHDILSAFEVRIHHTRQQEFAAASQQVEKIARLRLDSLNFGELND